MPSLRTRNPVNYNEAHSEEGDAVVEIKIAPSKKGIPATFDSFAMDRRQLKSKPKPSDDEDMIEISSNSGSNSDDTPAFKHKKPVRSLPARAARRPSIIIDKLKEDEFEDEEDDDEEEFRSKQRRKPAPAPAPDRLTKSLSAEFPSCDLSLIKNLLDDQNGDVKLVRKILLGMGPSVPVKSVRSQAPRETSRSKATTKRSTGRKSRSDDDDEEEEEEEEERGGRRSAAARRRGGLGSRRVSRHTEKKNYAEDDSESEEEEEEEEEELMDSVVSDDKASVEEEEDEEMEEEEDDEEVVIRNHRPAPAPSKSQAPSNRHSKGEIEKIIRAVEGADDSYVVKMKGASYRSLCTFTRAKIESKGKTQLLRNFIVKGGHENPFEVDDDWLKCERVIDVRGGTGRSKTQHLVKWRGLEYSEATWEEGFGAADEDEEDRAAVVCYEARSKPPLPSSKSSGALKEGKKALMASQSEITPSFQLPTFLNERKLRDYQESSVRWLANNWAINVNCILGDEMGLGKTAQSIAALECLRKVASVKGPFLIVAPLTTLPHWQREVETWTDMNCVCYAGSAPDRAIIQECELFYNGPKSGSRSYTPDEVKVDVILVSYEMLVKDSPIFKRIEFAAAVFDEAHRLKSIDSQARAVVTQLDLGWILLLSGTPIQNNLKELFSVLNLLDPNTHDSEEDFIATFGTGRDGTTGAEQVKLLQSILKPILLRRMKEDVETLPEKEEVIVWVQLTSEQKVYYKALLEKNIGALLSGSSNRSLPQMQNLAMELRKVCNHPFLCNGLKEDMMATRALTSEINEREFAESASGKMVLLGKLLPKLRAEGRKVLIFSQFKIMLDVLEDWCGENEWPVERIDGSITGRERQAAIDRYTKGSSEDGFIFLLSTKAGGQGITLTVADTCIIYDSDWNPQNDLQAMARCHRIGQKKEVTIYRLITKNTYEEQLWKTATLKQGLDEAVLGNSGSDSNPESDARRINRLLKNGAHGLLSSGPEVGEGEGEGQGEGGVKAEGDAFVSEGIDQILASRTEKRSIGGRAGNTFSVATFAVAEEAGGSGDLGSRKRSSGSLGGGEGGDLADYWETLMPEAAKRFREAAEAEKRGPVIEGRRKRARVNYQHSPGDSFKLDDEDEEGEEGRPKWRGKGPRSKAGHDAALKSKRQSKDEDYELAGHDLNEVDKEDEELGGALKGPRRKSLKSSASASDPSLVKIYWNRSSLKTLDDALMLLGPERWEEVGVRVEASHGPSVTGEVEKVGRALVKVIQVAGDLSSKVDKPQKKKITAASLFQSSAPAPAPAPAAVPAPAPFTEEDAVKILVAMIPSLLPPADDLSSPSRSAALEALSHPTNLKRLIKAGYSLANHLRDLKLVTSMCLQPSVANPQGEGGSSSALMVASPQPLHLAPLKQPLKEKSTNIFPSLPSWWNEKKCDEALLRAAVKIGVPPSASITPHWTMVAMMALEDEKLGLSRLISWSHEVIDQDKVVWILPRLPEAAAAAPVPTFTAPSDGYVRVPRSGHYVKKSLLLSVNHKDDVVVDNDDPSVDLIKGLMPKLETLIDILPSFWRTMGRVESGPEELMVKFKGYRPFWVPRDILLKANSIYTSELKASREGREGSGEGEMDAPAPAPAPSAPKTSAVDLTKMISNLRSRMGEAIKWDRIKFELSPQPSSEVKVSEGGEPSSPLALLLIESEERHTLLVMDIARRAREVFEGALTAAIEATKPPAPKPPAPAAAAPPPPPKAASLLSPDELKTTKAGEDAAGGMGGGYGSLNLTSSLSKDSKSPREPPRAPKSPRGKREVIKSNPLKKEVPNPLPHPLLESKPSSLKRGVASPAAPAANVSDGAATKKPKLSGGSNGVVPKQTNLSSWIIKGKEQPAAAARQGGEGATAEEKDKGKEIEVCTIDSE